MGGPGQAGRDEVEGPEQLPNLVVRAPDDGTALRVVEVLQLGQLVLVDRGHALVGDVGDGEVGAGGRQLAVAGDRGGADVSGVAAAGRGRLLDVQDGDEQDRQRLVEVEDAGGRRLLPQPVGGAQVGVDGRVRLLSPCCSSRSWEWATAIGS